MQEPETSPAPAIVMIKETTVTESTVEIDLPKMELTDEDVMVLKGFSQSFYVKDLSILKKDNLNIIQFSIMHVVSTTKAEV